MTKRMMRWIKTSEKMQLWILKWFRKPANLYKMAYRSYFDNKISDDAREEGKIEVIDGPFKGIKYTSTEAAGSGFIAKILGIYEQELHPVLEDIFKTDYNTIIDVGSAEGYYAIGMARRYPHSKVIAYDIDPCARELLTGMTIINEVADRVEIKDWCTKEVLMKDLKSGGRSNPYYFGL